MAVLEYDLLRFKKRVPLTISRGTSTHTDVLWLRWRDEGVEGWGEAVPFAIDDRPQPLTALTAAFETHREWLQQSSSWDRLAVEKQLWEHGAPSAFIAAVNQAMYDWLGKRVGASVPQLLGATGRQPTVTSVTIGINSPEGACRRVAQWLELGPVRAFKLKLGSPAGADADKAMYEAVRSDVPAGTRLSVDANGGWTLQTATEMSHWLAERGVDHLEQPLPRGREDDLVALHAASPLPIFVDESCRRSEDLPRLIGRIDGINIKFMKCGGLDGALRLAHAARAHGLRILVGCYGNSALGNTCAAALAPVVDYLDLDSHLNLEGDAFHGVSFADGQLTSPSGPGFGVTR